jgi:glucokinase
VNGHPPEADLAFGVDVGGTKVLGVALDAEGTVVAEVRAVTPRRGATPPWDVTRLPAEVLQAAARGNPAHVEQVAVEAVAVTGSGPGVGEEVADAVAGVLAALGAKTRMPARCVGVGVPGMLDRAGILRFAPNLPEAGGADLGALLARRLGGPAPVVANDANLAALAEHRLGAGRGVDDLLMVTLGTGIGGGLIVAGRLVTGARGFAGEIGHMVVDPSGPLCPCGRRGCWERFASGDGLSMLARRADERRGRGAPRRRAGGRDEEVRGEHVTEAAQAGDPAALAVMDEFGWWIALGLTNLAAAVDPARIVIGGGLAASGELVLGPTRRAFAALVEGGDRRPAVEIVGATLGERAGAIGAALAARAGGL